MIFAPKFLSLIIIVISCLMLSCAAIRPYEKEYLLSPLMDEGNLSVLQPSYAKAMCGSQERLASGGSGGGGSSCPTCGG